jgi:hypothetical protein
MLKLMYKLAIRETVIKTSPFNLRVQLVSRFYLEKHLLKGEALANCHYFYKLEFKYWFFFIQMLKSMLLCQFKTQLSLNMAR